MIEEYEDLGAAWDRAKALNEIAGRREYMVHGSIGGWIVRRHAMWDRAFIHWRQDFNRQVFGESRT